MIVKHHKLKHINPVDTFGLDTVAGISSDSNTDRPHLEGRSNRGQGVCFERKNYSFFFFKLTRFLDRP